MILHITNTDTQASTVTTEADLKESIRQLCTGYGLNRRQDVTLYIWHGDRAPGPAIEVRDIHGKTARMVL